MRPSKTGNPTKKETQHNVEFAEGGGSNEMFGTGDRTVTATSDAANPRKPGVTGKAVTGSGGKYAEGGKGKMFAYEPSVPAKAGITSPR